MNQGTNGKPKKRNWTAIVTRSIGIILIICSFGTGVVSIKLLLVGVVFLLGVSIREFFFTDSPERMRREAKRRVDEQLGRTEKVDIPPDEFLKGLGKDELP